MVMREEGLNEGVEMAEALTGGAEEEGVGIGES